MDDIRILSTMEEIKAFSDPYRFQILRTFYKFGRPATVKEIADAMEETPSKVHYHVKKFERLEIVKLVDTEEINGIIAKYYQPTAKAFKIDRMKALEPQLSDMLSETEVLCSNIFDETKKTFLKQLPQGNKKGTISAQDIYLSEEEFEEFTNWIICFCQKHSSEDRENKKPYLFFSGLICTENSEE